VFEPAGDFGAENDSKATGRIFLNELARCLSSEGFEILCGRTGGGEVGRW
jgi:hypothetical protein